MAPTDTPSKKEDEAPAVDKVRARIIANSWATTHPVTKEPLNFNKGDVVIITRAMFDSVNDTFRPSFEEVTED